MITPKKSLGQNFLADPQVARRIVDRVAPEPHDLILEIGPGTGALTALLAEAGGYLVAIEIDRRLIEELQSRFAGDRVTIIEADALAVDWNEVLDRAGTAWRNATGMTGEPRARVVANLPYYISTPIIERLMATGRRLFDMTLMLQSEVVERIASPPGSREYGYLSVLVQYHCLATKLFEVSPAAFRPRPKVQSAILRLLVRQQPAVDVADRAGFFALVRAAFAQRRKTIANNLKAARLALGINEEIDAVLARAGIEPMRRAETLSLDEFAKLFHALFE
ncbi:MAG TPA: 16S rRNA (adenine(1518)-N(6)/adenine(1519)-N(6))-dimethyltransferase RsmA [Blastocatellia bacterium]|nr:16S rRNA (adenine(1518)-N(6)/adenine(1519)-N(6))-dimethyltransferase RsmA [Blastocatellia bacterium]